MNRRGKAARFGAVGLVLACAVLIVVAGSFARASGAGGVNTLAATHGYPMAEADQAWAYHRFLISGQAVAMSDVEKYFRALRRAQRDIDVEHQKYTHFYLREVAAEFKPLVDVRAFGPGERLVFEAYTREVYEQTHRWMKSLELFHKEQLSEADYKIAVLV